MNHTEVAYKLKFKSDFTIHICITSIFGCIASRDGAPNLFPLFILILLGKFCFESYLCKIKSQSKRKYVIFTEHLSLKATIEATSISASRAASLLIRKSRTASNFNYNVYIQ